MSRLLVLALILAAGAGHAAVRLVDGACPPGGNGQSLTCGTSGPFHAISDAILVAQGGDQIEIRGAHDAFDGTYFEEPCLAPGITGLTCHVPASTGPTMRLVIEGCRAPICQQDETPIIRAAVRRSDWNSLGGGVYWRAMEATPQLSTTGGDRCDATNAQFDPYNLFEDDGAGLYSLAYAGDGVVAPVEGAWSFFAVASGGVPANAIAVHPVGGVNPSTLVYVPNFSNGVWLDRSPYVTLQHFRVEGTRAVGMDIGQSGPSVPGVVVFDVTIADGRRMAFHGQRLTGVVIDGVHVDNFGRGMSWSTGGTGGAAGHTCSNAGDSSFGIRLFHSDGGTIRNSTITNSGCTGLLRVGAGQPGWPCSRCPSPWNDPNHTQESSNFNAIQIKQTQTFTVDNVTIDHIQGQGFADDVSRDVTVTRLTVTNSGECIGAVDGTPDPTGCTTDTATAFCHYSNAVFDRITCNDTGLNDFQHCAAGFAGTDSVGWPCSPTSPCTNPQTFLFRLTNSWFINSGFGNVCIGILTGSAPGGYTVANNSFSGVSTTADAGRSRGIIVASGSTNGGGVLRNTASDQLHDETYVFTTGVQSLLTGGGITVDGDTLGPGTTCPSGCTCDGTDTVFRWNANLNLQSGQPSGGTCGNLAAFRAAFPLDELVAQTASPQFVSSSDLHLQSSSPARDAALTLGFPGPHDFDNHFRPQGIAWDSGAIEFFLGTTTSTTTTSTTSSTTITTLTSSTTTTSTTGATTSTTSTTITTTTSSTTATGPTSSTTSSTTSTTLPAHGFMCTGCRCTGCRLYRRCPHLDCHHGRHRAR